MEGVNLIKIYSKHICKCHDVSSLYNYYMLIIKKAETKTKIELRERGDIWQLKLKP
jgi:hypothetical protein